MVYKRGQNPNSLKNLLPKNGFKKGHIPWDKGKKLSKEHKEKLKKARKDKKPTFGKHWKIKDTSKMGHGNWQGGISFEPYSVDWNETLKKAIKERDRYTCQICGGTPETLFIHHIDYDKKNCNPDNLITLCCSCHTKTNFNRKYWKEYFQKLWLQ